MELVFALNQMGILNIGINFDDTKTYLIYYGIFAIVVLVPYFVGQKLLLVKAEGTQFVAGKKGKKKEEEEDF